jgi:hypothetical protein
LPGERNGKKSGMKLNIAAKGAEMKNQKNEINRNRISSSAV